MDPMKEKEPNIIGFPGAPVAPIIGADTYPRGNFAQAAPQFPATFSNNLQVASNILAGDDARTLKKAVKKRRGSKEKSVGDFSASTHQNFTNTTTMTQNPALLLPLPTLDAVHAAQARSSTTAAEVTFVYNSSSHPIGPYDVLASLSRKQITNNHGHRHYQQLLARHANLLVYSYPSSVMVASDFKYEDYTKRASFVVQEIKSLGGRFLQAIESSEVPVARELFYYVVRPDIDVMDKARSGIRTQINRILRANRINYQQHLNERQQEQLISQQRQLEQQQLAIKQQQEELERLRNQQSQIVTLNSLKQSEVNVSALIPLLREQAAQSIAMEDSAKPAYDSPRSQSCAAITPFQDNSVSSGFNAAAPGIISQSLEKFSGVLQSVTITGTSAARIEIIVPPPPKELSKIPDQFPRLGKASVRGKGRPPKSKLPLSTQRYIPVLIAPKPDPSQINHSLIIDHASAKLNVFSNHVFSNKDTQDSQKGFVADQSSSVASVEKIPPSVVSVNATAKLISKALPPNASSIIHIYDRRINFDHHPQDASMYSLLRSWIQDDPYRYWNHKVNHETLVELEAVSDVSWDSSLRRSSFAGDSSSLSMESDQKNEVVENDNHESEPTSFEDVVQIDTIKPLSEQMSHDNSMEANQKRSHNQLMVTSTDTTSENSIEQLKLEMISQANELRRKAKRKFIKCDAMAIRSLQHRGITIN